MQTPLIFWLDGLTDIGNRRKNNEDAWWAGQPGTTATCFMEPAAEPLQLDPASAPALLLVSDGVGGTNAGEVASRMAVQHVAEELARHTRQMRERKSAEAVIRAALVSANQAILAKAAEPECEGMGATLSLLCLTGGDAVWWAQVGDSRIYVCRQGRLRQISHDHSPVGRMRQQGKISEAEARVHPLRNQIDQSFGDPANPFTPEVGAEPCETGDVFLLCSDGLSDGLWDREIEEVLAGVRTPAEVRPAVQRLVATAKAASGRDNITAVLVLVVGKPAPSPTPSTGWRRWIGL